MDTNHETITTKPEGKYNCNCLRILRVYFCIITCIIYF